MGTERKKSSSQLKLRLSLQPGQRNTLIPCPACEGSGTNLREEGHRYRAQPCKWCEAGFVDQRMMKLFHRWLRIYNRGRVLGRCSSQKK